MSASFIVSFPLMSINQRKHIRFSLDIPALLVSKYGERHDTVLQQVSIGGCFTDWEEDVYNGDEFRLEIELPNKNRLPLRCKAIYRFEGTGIGARFMEITRLEQDLIAKIIAHRLEMEGLPVAVDPFERPSTYNQDDPRPEITNARKEKDLLLEKIMSGEEG